MGCERQGRPLFLRTSLSTRLVQWTRALGLWLRFLPSSKWFVGAEITDWCTKSGLNLLYLLSESTWMSRGHRMRSWLVFLFVPYCLRSPCAFRLLPVLVHHSQWDVSSDSVLLHQLVKVTRDRSVEPDEQGEEVRVFVRTWDRDIFRRVYVATLDCYSSDPHQEVSTLGRIIVALGHDVSMISLSGGSTNLVQTFCEFCAAGIVRS